MYKQEPAFGGSVIVPSISFVGTSGAKPNTPNWLEFLTVAFIMVGIVVFNVLYEGLIRDITGYED